MHSMFLLPGSLSRGCHLNSARMGLKIKGTLPLFLFLMKDRNVKNMGSVPGNVDA